MGSFQSRGIDGSEVEDKKTTAEGLSRVKANFARSTIRIHTVIRNGMEQVMLHSGQPQYGIPAFIEYVRCFLDVLRTTITKMRQSFPSSKMKALRETLAAKSYDGGAIKQAMVEIQDFLQPHLKAEEDFVGSANKMSTIQDEDVLRVEKHIREHAMKMDGSIHLAFIVTHLPREQANDFVLDDMPWIVRSLIVPYSMLTSKFCVRNLTKDEWFCEIQLELLNGYWNILRGCKESINIITYLFIIRYRILDYSIIHTIDYESSTGKKCASFCLDRQLQDQNESLHNSILF
eukprot:g14135.t1